MNTISLTFVAIVLGIASASPTAEVYQNDTAFDLSDFKFKSFVTRYDLLQFRRASRAAQVAQINDYADKVLSELSELIKSKGIEPVALPNIESRFKWAIFSGEASLKNGRLYGLTTLRRNGDVVIQYDDSNIKARIPLRFEELSVNYDYTVQFMHIGPRGLAKGTVKGCQLLIELNLDAKTLLASVDNYRIVTLGKLSLKFYGSILAWIVNLVVKAIIPAVQPLITKELDKFTHNALNSLVASYNKHIQETLGNAVF